MKKIKCPHCSFVAYGESKERAELILLIHLNHKHKEEVKEL